MPNFSQGLEHFGIKTCSTIGLEQAWCSPHADEVLDGIRYLLSPSLPQPCHPDIASHYVDPDEVVFPFVGNDVA